MIQGEWQCRGQHHQELATISALTQMPQEIVKALKRINFQRSCSPYYRTFSKSLHLGRTCSTAWFLGTPEPSESLCFGWGRHRPCFEKVASSAGCETETVSERRVGAKKDDCPFPQPIRLRKVCPAINNRDKGHMSGFSANSYAT
jgi:hypothetical protein